MISLISSLSLKLYLNSLVYHRNIFGSSSKVFGNLWKSSGIFGNFRKFSENVRERSSCLRNNFEISLEIFRRWSEIFGKSSKTPSSACLYNKKNITRRLEDMNFIFSSRPPCNILYLHVTQRFSNLLLVTNCVPTQRWLCYTTVPQQNLNE